MNVYKALNEITLYIDNHLTEKIDYGKLSRMMAVNVYTMEKIFSLLAGISLGEYIRKRRLSNAGVDLYNTNMKVIEVALLYQYTNATSFSRAFYAFHGIKPSQVTKKSQLRNFPRIIFDENTRQTTEVSYQIKELPAFSLYGVGISTNNKTVSKMAPDFFKEFLEKYESIYGFPSYGMTTYTSYLREECNGYYVLYDFPVTDKGFIKKDIPTSKWLVFRIDSQEAFDIQRVTDNFYLEFLPSCKYNLSILPELEHYHDGVCDLLIPIN